jgi:Tfp pilus assembly protein PilO
LADSALLTDETTAGRMSLSRTRLLVILLAVCFVIGFVYLGMDYISQQNQQKILQEELQSTRQAMSLLPPVSEDLAQRLADAEQANQTAKESSIPAQIETTKVIETIFQVGDACNLKLVPLSTTPWMSRSVTGRNYHVFVISLEIKGSLSDIIDFIGLIEDAQTASVDNLVLNPTAEDSSAGMTTTVTATLDLALYTRVETTQ